MGQQICCTGISKGKCGVGYSIYHFNKVNFPAPIINDFRMGNHLRYRMH